MDKQVNNKQEIQDKIKGALWGAVLGDVIGAFLQFNRAIDQAKISQAFVIKGGGVHKLQPGQPTDDSQLSYALAKGLIRGNGVLNVNLIAQQMGNWFLSKPIDVGNTIRKSIPKACNMKVHQAHLCRKGAKQCSKQSQSNGTLMAIIPLAIWCRQLSPADIIKAVKEYTVLIHPHQLVILSNSFYALMVTYLLNNNCKEDIEKVRIDAFSHAKTSIEAHILNCQQKKQFLIWIKAIESSFEEPQTLLETVSPIKKQGWVRVAFSYAIHNLIKGNNFKQSIHNILRLKGDTDTNACIAGGLIGSSYGFKHISAHLDKQIQKIQNWRPKNVKRPDWLVPGLVIDKIASFLLEKSPTQLKIVGGIQSQQEKTKK